MSEAWHGLLYVSSISTQSQITLSLDLLSQWQEYITRYNRQTGVILDFPWDTFRKTGLRATDVHHKRLNSGFTVHFSSLFFRLLQRWGTAKKSDSINKPATCNVEQLKFWSSAQLPRTSSLSQWSHTAERRNTNTGKCVRCQFLYNLRSCKVQAYH